MAVKRNERGQRKVDMSAVREALTAQQYAENLYAQNQNAAAAKSAAVYDGWDRLAQMTPQSPVVSKVDDPRTFVKRLTSQPDATPEQMRRQALNAANADNINASRMQAMSDDQLRQQAVQQMQRPRVAAEQATYTTGEEKRRAAYEQERARQQRERNRAQYDPNSQYADIYAQYDVQENENNNALSKAIKADQGKVSDAEQTMQALERERRSILTQLSYMQTTNGMYDRQLQAELNKRLSQVDYQIEMLTPEVERHRAEQARLQAAYNERIHTEEFERDERNASKFERVNKNADFESVAASAMTDKEGFNPFVDNPAYYAAQLLAETGEVPNGSGSAFLYMTDDEAKTYSYYIGQGDRVKADNYFKAIEHRLNERMANAQYTNLYQWSVDHPWLAAAASVGANLGSFNGYLAGVGQNIENAITGIDTPIDPNSAAFLPVRASGIMREGALSGLNDTQRLFAETGLSIADMAATSQQYTEFVLRAMGYSSTANTNLGDTLERVRG